MDEERLRVLKMLEEGRINAEQAAGLLTALEGARTAEPVGSQEKTETVAEAGSPRNADWSELAHTVAERVATAVERAQAEGRDWATLGRDLSARVQNAISEAFAGRGLDVDTEEPKKSNYTTAKLTRNRLSRMADGISYTNYGTLRVADDVPEELLAQKISSYTNYGRTVAPANLLGVLEDRCEDNYGAFLEPEEEAEQREEAAQHRRPARENHSDVTLTMEYLSAMQDGTDYENHGRVTIPEDLPEDLLARKIASYDNHGTTIGPMKLLALLEDRGANFGHFREAE
jgi:hypothetical protein